MHYIHSIIFIISILTFFGYSQDLNVNQRQQLENLLNESPSNGIQGQQFQYYPGQNRALESKPKNGPLSVIGINETDSLNQVTFEQQLKLDSVHNVLDSLEIDSTFLTNDQILSDTIDFTQTYFDSLLIIDSLYDDSLHQDSLVQDSIDHKYRIYGLDVFKQEIKIESNLSDIPEDYKIVEGDKIHLQLWGSQNVEKTYTVEKGGDVFFDLINKKTQAIGLSYRKLKSIVNRAMKKVGSQGDVSLLAVHAYKIHFSGNVKNHGSELVPPYLPFWKVLMLSKGPNHFGSLRNIQVIRKNKTVAKFDLYEFLEKGKMPKVTLQDNDIIHFGQRENVVEVKGFIKRDNVYEIKKNETLKDLIHWAAGLKSDSPVSSVVEIRRAIPLNKRQDPREIYEYIAVDLTKDYSKVVLEDGDEIFATEVDAIIVNYVHLKGEGFVAPGKYRLTGESENVFEFIAKNGGLRSGFKPEGEIVSDLDTNREAKSINLLSEQSLHDIILKGKDVIHAYHKTEDIDTVFSKISIKGYVREPIEVPYAEGMTLGAALRQGFGIKAGGLSEVYVKFEDAFKKIAYKKVDLLNDNPEDVILQENTEIFTFDTDKMDPKLPVVILAPNKDPLVLDYSDDLNLDVIIKRLEGLPFEIDSSNVEINKPLFDSENAFTTRAVKLEKGPLFNSSLISAGDVVIFRLDLRKENAGYVILDGEFRTPGKYILLSASESMESVISKAGGLRPRANIYSLQLIRNGSTNPIPVDAERDDDNVEFDNIWYLNSGDTVRVLKNNSTVSVVGSVLNPTKVSYREDYDWEDYISYGAGGALDTADIELTYVIYPNGKSQKLSMGLFCSPDIVPGAKIVVPEKPFIPPEAPEPQTQWGVILPGIAAIISAIGTIVSVIIVSTK